MVQIAKILACLLLFVSFNFQTHAQCTASFSYTVTGNTINVTHTGSGGTPQWEFGDGTTGFGATTSHTYSGPGTFTVCEIILNFFGGICDSTCSVVTIGSGMSVCNADFGYSVSGQLANFNNMSTSSFPILSTFWDFGDGTTSTTSSPLHAYATGGTFYPCLTIITNDSCISTHCDTLYIAAPVSCTADFSSNITNTTADFTNLSSGGYATVLWDFGDGTTSNQVNPSHLYSGLGTYTVCLTVFDSLGTYCDSICQPVTISSLPTCQAQFSYTLSASQVSFQDNSSGTGTPVAWSWDFGDGNTSNQQNPLHVFAAGTYVVCLNVGFSDSCTSSICDTLTVQGTGCTAFWTAVVNGNDVDYTDMSTSFSGQPIVSWLWVLGGGASSFLQNPQHTFSGPGTWYTCLYITTADSCSATYCDTVVTTGAVGIRGEQLSMQAQVWPNPATDRVNIGIPSGYGAVQLRFINGLGQIVWEQPEALLQGQPMQVGLDLQPEWHGIYWLQIHYPDQQVDRVPVWIIPSGK